ncbi:MAG: peroxiredoxin family protein [Gemmatimonadetes bacterium]|nr:peroxiredoxin family protein [Gemmatimonadota bacterium]NNK48407.1 redoxin domain-containing protein [Gemmatimonadota bacterium]
MEAYRDQYARLFGEGEEVVLLAVNGDEAEAQADWARDEDFPFLFASDPGGEVGKQYGAARSRNVFIIDPEGRIAWRAIPFREVDPTAYDELGAAVKEIAGGS